MSKFLDFPSTDKKTLLKWISNDLRDRYFECMLCCEKTKIETNGDIWFEILTKLAEPRRPTIGFQYWLDDILFNPVQQNPIRIFDKNISNLVEKNSCGIFHDDKNELLDKCDTNIDIGYEIHSFTGNTPYFVRSFDAIICCIDDTPRIECNGKIISDTYTNIKIPFDNTVLNCYSDRQLFPIITRVLRYNLITFKTDKQRVNVICAFVKNAELLLPSFAEYDYKKTITSSGMLRLKIGI